MQDERFLEAARGLSRSSHAVALTGAGISVESGIPDFRSAGGLWSRFDPMEYGHIESFRANPAKVWKMLIQMDALLTGARFNPAHRALALLEERRILKAVITQNFDSLHQKAGSRKVIEYHGHNRALRCDECGREYAREGASLESLPPRCACGGPMRPAFVFFGEMIPEEAREEAAREARQCDLLLVVGTSASVAPASLLPVIAREGGAFIVEINPGETGLGAGMVDLRINEAAGRALPAILALMAD
jgi:NAD-dependent deacetylase